MSQICWASEKPDSSLSGSVAPSTVVPNISAMKLEREKFEFQIQLEAQKLEVERLKSWLTGGSIVLPLLLGIFTLAWQTRSANRLKDRDAREMFELKATEIVFRNDSPGGTKNRARALASLFPGKFPESFGDSFEPSKFGGPSIESKVEVFKAACTKVQTPEDVYSIWYALFPGDTWIEPLVLGLTKRQCDEARETA